MKKYISFILKALKKTFILIINILLLLVSYIIPKDKKIIIIGGWFGKRFADNSKFLYIYLNENKEKLNLKKIIWITDSNEILALLKDKKLDVYKKWSLKSIWYHLRSTYHIIDQSADDINPFFSIRAKRINLWHGFPLKNIGSFTKHYTNSFFSKIKFKFIFNKGFWGNNYLLATSDFSAEVIGKAFNIQKNKIIISGYPRNYNSFTKNLKNIYTEEEKYFLNKIRTLKNNGYIILGYFPTFRDYKETIPFGTDNKKELKDFFDSINIKKIAIICKFHFAGIDDKFIINNLTNFINMPPEVDIYSFIDKVDILMTDYSSIFFDYLLWEKPMIFFPYDLEYYKNEDRGLIFDYYEFTPGPKVFSLEELKKLLDNLEKFENDYKNKYFNKAQKIKNKLFYNNKEMNIEHFLENLNKL